MAKEKIAKDVKKGKLKARPPIRRTVVNITMPIEFTEAIKEISKNSAEMKGSVEQLVAEQQQGRVAREKERQEKNLKEALNASTPKSPTQIVDVGPKKSVFWEVLQVIGIFAILALLCFCIFQELSKTTNLPNASAPATEITKSDVVTIVEDKIAPLKKEVAENCDNFGIKIGATNKEVSELGFRVTQLEEKKLSIESEQQKEQVAAVEAKESVPQIPEKKVVVIPPPTHYVNLLLIANDGSIVTAVKRVCESDVTQDGKSTNWFCNGSINNWPRVLSSYRYTDGPPVVGMIRNVVVVNSKPETVNVPVAACDVYKDREGNNILYEDAPNHYSCITKGSGFMTMPINHQNP